MRDVSLPNTPDLDRAASDAKSLDYSPLLIREIQSAVEKVLSSRTFRAAQGQRVFLQYTVAQAIAGRGRLLKEYVIGTEALGRGESFDPRLDPIVRTQARKLRARLEKYYQTEGQSDPLRIDFPKGCYVPLFRRNSVSGDSVVPVGNEPAAVPAAVSVVPASAPHSRWKVASIALAASLVLFSIVGIYYVRTSRPLGNPVAVDGASLAVLPFANLGSAKDGEILSNGLTDELIQSLRTVKGLQVVAHASAFQFKAEAGNAAEIGRKLHVRTLLLGSVNRIGDRIQVSAQLSSVPNGYHLWTGNYDRKSADTRAVEVEIAKSVANSLGMAMTRSAGGGEELAAMLSNRPMPSPLAHESYLKGLYFWNKLTADDLRKATTYFEEAVSEDPSFARAYAALADCYVMAPQLSSAPPLEVAGKIRNFADKALALDESVGEAHIDLAISSEYEFDWARAEVEFKKGLALSPGNAVGHLWYAKYLAMVGRKSEVLTQRRLAADLDPVSAYAAQAVAGYFSVMGRYDAAISQFHNALALEPNLGLAHQGLGFTYLLAGRHSEGLQELKFAQKTTGDPRRMALVAYAYALGGQTEYAQHILNGFLAQARREPFPALAIADVYIGLGDKDRAFEWLDKAVDQRDLNLDLKWDPLFDTVRPDPRYSALLHRMKLT